VNRYLAAWSIFFFTFLYMLVYIVIFSEILEIGLTGRSKALALVVSFWATSKSCMEHTNERRHARYRGTRARGKGTCS
jgi:hypothetical protein